MGKHSTKCNWCIQAPKVKEDKNMSKGTNFKPNNNNKSGRGRNRNQGNGNKCQNKNSGAPSESKSQDLEHVENENVNDPKWYYKDEKLMEQVSNFSFTNYIGHPITLGNDEARYSVPAHMIFTLNPSAGWTYNDAPNTGINLAGLRNYINLTANNAKTTNYAPQDVTILILALGEILSYFSQLKKELGLAFTINMRNRLFPEAVLNGLVNAEDLLSKRADYVVKYNTLVTSFNKIPVPGTIKYFDKCSTLYDKIYLDQENNPLCQTFQLVPGTTWKLNEEGTSQGSVLETISTCIGPTHTFKEQCDVLQSMINALLTSSTMNYIYSDILRVSDKEGLSLWSMPILDMNYGLVPEYSYTAILQMRNATPMGLPISTQDQLKEGYTLSNNVYADVEHNTITYRPFFKHNTAALSLDAVIRFEHENPSTGDIVDATRYMVRGTSNYWSDVKAYENGSITLPDHYVVFVQAWTDVIDADHRKLFLQEPGMKGNEFYPQNADVASKFTCCPTIYTFAESPKGTYSSLVGIIGDLEWYTTLDEQYFSMANDLIDLSLYEL